MHSQPRMPLALGVIAVSAAYSAMRAEKVEMLQLQKICSFKMFQKNFILRILI